MILKTSPSNEYSIDELDFGGETEEQAFQPV